MERLFNDMSMTRILSCSRRLWLDLDYCLNLYRHVKWQRISPNCTPGVVPDRLSENLHQDIRASVHYQMLAFEINSRIDNTKDLCTQNC
jgi:hypothetical protein